jgi:hypothetical protein
MFEKPQAEHEILQKLVGNWKVLGECSMPDGTTDKSESGVTFKSINGMWVVGEGTMPGPEGDDFRTIMTLGFDPVQSRYVGTFVASCMTKLWVYNGAYDAAARKLVLDATGPRFDGKPGEAPYQDTIEFVSDDEFILASQMQGDDGKWFSFMKSVHNRVRS